MSIFLIAGILPASVAAASTEVAYIDGNRVSKSVMATPIDNTTTTLTTGWYVVQGNVSTTNLTVNGHVSIILADGSTLVANSTGDHAAVRVKSGNSLSLFGQTLGTGSLNAASSGRGAGIGGNGGESSDGESCGAVTLYGANVTTTSMGGGTGSLTAFSTYDGGSGGTITINGGKVIVSGRIGGGDGGAGVPGFVVGGDGGSGSALRITGGTITVSGKIGGGSAGVGSGMFGTTGLAGAAGTCVITGGSLKAASMQPAPTNGTENGNLPVSLTTVTLSGVAAPLAVKAFVTSMTPVYGARDVRTDAVGKLCLWLPSGTSVLEAFTQVNRYTGLVAAGTAGTLTVSAIDTQKPVVQTTVPADDSLGVAIDGNLSITFSKVMDLLHGNLTLSTGSSGPDVLTGGIWTHSGTVYTVPYSGLDYSEAYTVSASGFQDISGITADSLSFVFLTESRPQSADVGAQNGFIINGTAGSVSFPVSTFGIDSGTAITLNNLNAVVGITLDTLATSGNETTIIVSTTAETPAGSHPLSITIDSATSNTFTLEVGVAVFGISLSQTGLLAFPDQAAGYSPIPGHSVTITNTGNSPTGIVTLDLTGEDSDCFMLSGREISSLPTPGSDHFTIRPNDNLAIGDYTATVVIGGENITPLTFGITFQVNSRTGNSITGITEPAAATINGNNITATVANSVTRQPILLSVSDGANWRLYRDITCSDELIDKEMELNVGANIAYIKVTAEDGTTKLYLIVILRSEEAPVVPPFTRVTVGVSITDDGGMLQLNASVNAAETMNALVLWSIESGQDFASISSTGLLTAIDNGIVIVRATAQDGSGVYQDLQVTITGQFVGGVGMGGGNLVETTASFEGEPTNDEAEPTASLVGEATVSNEEEAEGNLAGSQPPPGNSDAVPQTGENGGPLITITLGMAVLCSAAALFFIRRKRRTSNSL